MRFRTPGQAAPQQRRHNLHLVRDDLSELRSLDQHVQEAQDRQTAEPERGLCRNGSVLPFCGRRREHHIDEVGGNATILSLRVLLTTTTTTATTAASSVYLRLGRRARA